MRASQHKHRITFQTPSHFRLIPRSTFAAHTTMMCIRCRTRLLYLKPTSVSHASKASFISIHSASPSSHHAGCAASRLGIDCLGAHGSCFPICKHVIPDTNIRTTIRNELFLDPQLSHVQPFRGAISCVHISVSSLLLHIPCFDHAGLPTVARAIVPTRTPTPSPRLSWPVWLTLTRTR
jgi:hypothetical protein